MPPKRLLWGCGALLLCAMLAFGGGCAPLALGAPPSANSVDFIMDTFVKQRWYGENAQQTCDEIAQALRQMERALSLYDEQSELSRVNAAAGGAPVALSQNTYALLRQAWTLCDESGGLFDITVAPLSLLWNVTGENPQVPAQQEIDRARALVDYRALLLDDVAQTAQLTHAGMRLDLGGLAKGAAANVARQIAQKNGVQGFASIGGNMVVEGVKQPSGEDFTVGVRDPRGEATNYFASLAPGNLIMATSGDYERYFEQDGVRYHHLIDPFSGYPADGGLLSVTVLAEDGVLADYLSTAIFLGGTAKLDEALARTDCMVLAVTKTQQVYASDGLWPLLRIHGNQYRFMRPE